MAGENSVSLEAILSAGHPVRLTNLRHLAGSPIDRVDTFDRFDKTSRSFRL